MSKSNFEKLNNVMKIFWLAMCFITLVIVVVMGFIDGWSRWVYYLAFPALAFIMYIFRKFAGSRVARSIEKKKDDQGQ